MHPSAITTGELFFETYWEEKFTRILDIGSMDVNGSLRGFAPKNAEYMGIDLSPGSGVDLVLEDPYKYPFEDGHFDAILSTSCYEHDMMFWLTFSECCRVVSDRGYIYINAPSSGHYHGYPFDHWRFYPDAGLALERWGRRQNYPISLVESFTVSKNVEAFADCVMIFTKRQNFKPQQYIADRSDDYKNVRKCIPDLINPEH